MGGGEGRERERDNRVSGGGRRKGERGGGGEAKGGREKGITG